MEYNSRLSYRFLSPNLPKEILLIYMLSRYMFFYETCDFTLFFRTAVSSIDMNFFHFLICPLENVSNYTDLCPLIIYYLPNTARGI